MIQFFDLPFPFLETNKIVIISSYLCCSVLGNIGDLLDSVRFLNGPSNINSDMKFNFLQQCALYVEPENFTKTVHGWVTPRYTPVKYLYQSSSGTPPPLGMRSAVPLGGMGTGNAAMRLPQLWSRLTSSFPSVELE